MLDGWGHSWGWNEKVLLMLTLDGLTEVQYIDSQVV